MLRCLSALTLLASLALVQGPEKPPVAPVREVTDTYFGRAIVDPYRWMENEKDPELASWLKAQNAYTRAVLDSLPRRAKLLDRILELDRATARVFGVQIAAGKYFFYKIDPDGDIPKLYMRDVTGGPVRLLVDPDKDSPKGTHSAIDFFAPSGDGTKVGYGISQGGSEQSVIHVMDVATGKTLPDTIDRALYSYVSWLPDNSSFLYFRLPKRPADAPASDRLKGATTYVHRLGTDPDADAAVFGPGVSPHVKIAGNDWPLVFHVPGSRHLLGVIAHGVKNEVTLYTAPVGQLAGAKTPWRKLADVEDEVTAADLHGDDVYLLTHKGAPHFKIVRTSAVNPDLAKAEVVVPEGKAVISSLGVAADGVYYKEMEAGMSWIGRVGWGGKPERIPLPFQGAVAGSFTTPAIFTSPTRPGITFGLTGWTRSPVWLTYDPARKQTTDTGLVAPSTVDFSGIEATQVLVPSHDGVKVPLSILHKAGLSRDGRRPTLIVGYGAYGISMEPSFQSARLAWLERGGVLAFAHVRGGGEYGEEWHLGGQKKTKVNTILDFTACSDHLVKSGYTSPRHLGGSGTSAGGILIGGALVRRPDLYAAVIPRVGVMNALRFEVTQGGPSNTQEFGTVAVKEEFEALQEMDAYHHVKRGSAYPAVLVTTGFNDPRVPVWQPAKFAARLQAATSSGKPVLLRVEYDAGHGMGSTRTQAAAQLADEWSFLLWQFGDPEFQPASSAARPQPDHVMLGIRDLDEGIRLFEEQTGVRPVVGGVHPGRGTQNALVSLGDGVYVEIIAPAKSAAASATDDAAAGLAELARLTPIGWAVSVPNVEEARRRLAQAGFEVSEPRAGSRAKPDGSLLEWQTFGVAKPQIAGAPFFIRWSQKTTHPSADSPAGCRLGHLAITSPSPDDVGRVLAAVGVDVALERGDRGGMTVTLQCPKGTARLASE